MIVFIVAAGLLISSGGRAAAQGSGEVFTDEASGVRYTVEAFIPANFPVGLAFAPDGRLFYNEKTTGSVRVVLPDGTRPTEPVITLPTDSLQERGMLGIAVDPDFERNNLLWLVHTAAGTAANWPSNRLLRFPVGENNTAGEPETLIDLPITNGELLHNGGNVHFDADGRLFISFGDYGDASNAQNLDTMQGALHRFDVTEDGLVAAEGNPFEPSSIYAYGFRNPWDFDFDPVTG
ncbi:MAG: PQQ-dependent sugar dehydrogenase, partial [Chloroflexota bacterium]